MLEGQQIGQYRVIRKIGEGGMGAVFLAEHALIGRRAAIKVLLPGLSVQREIVDRFFNEARATTAISDPGIVQVFDFGIHHDGSAYIVMEFLEGEPLDARMKKLGRLTSYDALRITRQASGSLAAAHARGIIHRDLKPENLFLVPDAEAMGGERAKILDFGIAKLGGIGNAEPGQMRTRTGALMGTPVYMSPEQCRGAGSVDHRSDIYSMGCVLFHMITGRPPFDGEGVGDIIAAHLREPPRPPSALVPGIPEGVDQLVMTCLAKPAEQRYQQIADLARACDALMSRITATGVNSPTIAIATPVPPGFRSEYPGVAHAALPQGTQPGTMLAPNPSHPGTVVLGTPTTLGTASGQTQGTIAPASNKRWALVAVLVLLFAGGGVAAGVMLGGGGGGGGNNAASPNESPDEPEGTGDGSQAGTGTGTGSASGTAVVATTPDAGVAPAVDAAVTAVVDVAQPDAGTGVAVNAGSGSGSGSAKKIVKKKKKKGSGSGSGTGDLYGDR